MISLYLKKTGGKMTKILAIFAIPKGAEGTGFSFFSVKLGILIFLIRLQPATRIIKKPNRPGIVIRKRFVCIDRFQTR